MFLKEISFGAQGWIYLSFD